MLPHDLWLFESHPGQAVINVTLFNFYESVVGAYADVVISLAVVPWAPPSEKLPHGAFFPIFLGSTTDVSRIHATEEWKLPDYGRCVEIKFGNREQQRYACVEEQGQLIVEL